MRPEWANEPAAPNAGKASQLTIEHHWPGVGEPGRSATSNTMTIPHALFRLAGPLVLLMLLGCRSDPRASHTPQAVAQVPISNGAPDFSDDAKLQQQIAGSWILPLRDGGRSSIVFHSDGKYSCKITGYGGMPIAELEGTFAVKDGCLVDTVTKDSQAGAQVPRTSRAAIVRVSLQELVLKREDVSYKTVLRKDSR